MPEMSGSDTFYALRKIDKQCKVILTSGFKNDENLKELKEAGLAAFINKPFSNTELSHLISDILQE